MKPKLEPRRSVLVLSLAGAVSFITATAIAHVWTHLQVIDYGYKISKAARLRDRILEQNRRLKLELAVLKDPARIARAAADQFGLQPTEPGQLRRLRLRAGDGAAHEGRSAGEEPAPMAGSSTLGAGDVLLADRLLGLTRSDATLAGLRDPRLAPLSANGTAARR